jgi:ribosomal protein S18 acetylase RimI-like enzyme
MAIVTLLTVFLVLAILERLSTTPFALYANAWACVVPTSTTTTMARRSRKTTRTAKTTSLVSWERHKHGSIFSPFLDNPLTKLLANRTSVGPSTSTSPTTTINTKETNSDSKPNNNSNNPVNNDLFFIRPALFVDMDRASNILADGFFKGPKTNWLTYQYEKFITYLSLEANFPRTQQQRSRYEIYVASCIKTGEVWGVVEIDARGTTGERTSKVYEKSGGSPYMCNLAVDERHLRKGIATSLVYECERQVKEWYSEEESKKKKKDDETINNDIIYNSKNEMINNIFSSNSNERRKAKNIMTNSICLKVRESNKAAVRMYQKLGYATIFEEIEGPSINTKTAENILLMRKELSSLSPSPSPAAEMASE